MNIIEKKLASRLLYLPIDLTEKVLLWLTYRGLKPVSDIYVLKRNRSHIRRMMHDPEYRKSYKSPYDFDSRSSRRIRNWIRDAGLFLAIEPGYELSWHVSKNSDYVKQSTELLHKFDFGSEVQSGLLFGFPESSARAYAKNRDRNEAEIAEEMVGAGALVFQDPYLKDKYFTPYILYNMPKVHIRQDSQIAKKWADTLRKDVPQLAIWFEKNQRLLH